MALALDRLQRTEEALERGRELYVAGRFHEAAQAWEDAWREEVGHVGRLLQGLVQAAGAYHKMGVLKHPVGMVRLLALSLERIGPLPDGFAGLELDRFRAGLSRSWEEGIRWLEGGPSPSGAAPLGRVSAPPAGPAPRR